MTYTASPDTVRHIAALVEQTRPEWDEFLVRIVLHDLAPRVDGNDLAIAALRCAADPKLPTPKAIGWRGRHWRDLDSTPPDLGARPICRICGKPEHRCYDRKGIDDDHAFEPTNVRAR